MPDRIGGQVLRFLVVGGANTGLTYLLLLLLSSVVDVRLAYTAAFATGVVLNAVVTGPLVFRSRPTTHRRTMYAAWLGLVYLAGMLAVQLALWAGVHAQPVLAAVPLLVTAPLSFLGGRLLLGEPADGRSRTAEGLVL